MSSAMAMVRRRTTQAGRTRDGCAGCRLNSDVDPVCGKTVRTDRAKPSVFAGTVYYFCSRECRERFEAAPELYVPGAVDGAPAREEDHVNG